MRKILASFVGAGLLVSPVQAADWRDQPSTIQPGVFAGAKLRISMRGKSAGKPRAALGIAPAQSRISGDAMVNTSIGEGLALNFTSGKKPTVTLAGVRADRALGLTSGPGSSAGTRLGMSDGGKVALGVGAALLIGAGIFYAVAVSCDESDSSDDCP